MSLSCIYAFVFPSDKNVSGCTYTINWFSVCSIPESSVTKLPRDEIKHELLNAQRKHLEQVILPDVLELEEVDPLFDSDSVDFSLRIKKRLEESKKLQKNLQDRIRGRMKKFGEEKLFVVKTPEGEVVKGFPEAEVKWMFGEKEVVVPKAIQLHLRHGWKKWQDEAKADLKQRLLEDVDFGKQYIAQRQVNFGLLYEKFTRQQICTMLYTFHGR